jgi:energy-coupling factor transporter transmembrane protein EcfT
MLGVLMIDGLALRDKRKFQGARESTFLFHRLKPLAKLSFFSLFIIYMVMPYGISPSVFLIPMVALSSLFTMLSIKSFKKYL